jgi:class 3 adenylate cyclase/tetratricopeptide (TPR) repeat protein
VTCASCGAENRDDAKFCRDCGSALARTCPNGHPVAADARFCDECGAALAAREAISAAVPAGRAPQAERRLVSVLFADLVGFTTASEARDAEDTRELLTEYFETARAIVERYGGVVEKFIGDAVMAVWGAPVTQEDDAERAVRAGLDLVEAVPQLDSSLQARAGVLTGEAAVTVGAEGQGMVAGDLVNTASRIQSEADPGAVLVGDATRRASEAAVVYEEAGLHELKGKARAIPLFRATRVVSARGGEGRSAGLEAPFVGRERELRLVKDLFHATAAEGKTHLLSVIGIAGIGKSRLAWEFEKYVDGVVETVYWHRGRCLAYGEGVAYWALAEMIRSRAQIVETDDESDALRKLRETVAEHVADPEERDWIEPRLQQLLGLVERSGSDREDLFSAWRRFFELLAERATVVLLFEDLHWADSGLVAFVEHLLDWSRNLPIFVFALARPELAERHPGFPGPARSATTLALDPLSDEAMDELLRGLVPGLPDDIRESIRERADGVPLYAVETVRMLLDRGLLEPAGNEYRVTGAIDSLEVPETLHALIAARLDGLDARERRVLGRGAVLGKTFTAQGLGALSALEPGEVEEVLASLVRKELLAPVTDPRSPERGQYGFLQALVQRIAYEMLARGERRALHLAAASFLAEGAGIDPDEIAEVIATHYRDAYEAAPSAENAEEVRSQAIEWLRRAGERAAALAATEDARRTFEQAAELADDPLERAALLEQAGELANAGHELEQALDLLEQARSLYEEAGRTHDAARAASPLSRTLWDLGRIDEAVELVDGALHVLGADDADADVARLAAEAARVHYFRGDEQAARGYVEQALAIAESQLLPEVLSQALNTKGIILLDSRPREGRALVREALDVALEHDLVPAALRAYNNLAVAEIEADRLEETRRLALEGLELARQRGNRNFLISFVGWETFFRLFEGDWDGAFALADELLPDEPTANAMIVGAHTWLAVAARDRDDLPEARRRLTLVAPEARASKDLQLRSNVLHVDAFVAADEGRAAEALQLCRLAIEKDLDPNPRFATLGVEIANRIAQEHGLVSELADLTALFVDVSETRLTRYGVATLNHARGVVAAANGDEDGAVSAFATALAAARSADQRWHLAEILGDYARALVDFGRADEAEPLLAEARELWQGMGATAQLERLAQVRRPPAEVPV